MEVIAISGIKKILIACEFSGIVREKFKAKGHDVISCDLLPSEIPGNHYQGDVFDIIDDGFDMMIAFPPCTHLAVSGARWFPEKRKDGRQQEAIDFFLRLANANINKIVIENPVGIMSKIYRKPDQIIQPYQFGESFRKKTCLWIKNLPKLKHSNIVDEGEIIKFKSGKIMSKWYADLWRLKKSERAKERSRTFKGIAEAMANQWG